MTRRGMKGMNRLEKGTSRLRRDMRKRKAKALMEVQLKNLILIHYLY